jgi:antitoxin component of RelBE/YafQ-DinJ toxin-antitoxin module
MAREEKIIIRVSEDMKNSFQALAEEMGMTMSGLGSFVIGNFIREEKHRRLMQEKMLEQISPQLTDSLINNVDLNDPRVADAIAKTFQTLAAQNRP